MAGPQADDDVVVAMQLLECISVAHTERSPASKLTWAHYMHHLVSFSDLHSRQVRIVSSPSVLLWHDLAD